MRILVISNIWPPEFYGGYELACRDVVEGLKSIGHDVMTLTSATPVGRDERNPTVRRALRLNWFRPTSPEGYARRDLDLRTSVASDYNNSIALCEIIDEFNPDIVYVWNTFGLGGLGLFDVLCMKGVPWVCHLMDRLPEFLVNWTPSTTHAIFMQHGLKTLRTGRFISISDQLVSEIERLTPLTFERAPIVVPAWVRPTTPVLSPPFEPPWRFVFAGTMSEEKGCHIIIEAAKLLLEAGCSDFVVDLFGPGDGERFVEEAQAAGVGGIVRVQGPLQQEKLRAKFASYNALLFPTWEREPFGFVAIEAASQGCLPIITRSCGAAERLVDGTHAIKIDRNANDLADAMRFVMDNPVEMLRMALAAQNAVNHGLNFESCLARINEVLEAEVRSSPPRILSIRKDTLLLYVKHNLDYGIAYGIY